MPDREGRRLRLLGTLVALGVSGVALALGLALVKPTPPRSLTMATGPEGGAYQLLVERYRAVLARHGVKLGVVTSNGSVDNLARLRDASSGVSVAFVQGGITNPQESPQLVSLGTVFYEPIWAFLRGPGPSVDLASWARGRRISIGPEGSGTHKLARELLVALGVNLDEVRLLGSTPLAAAEALLRGELDMAVMVASWESPVVRRLLAEEQLSTMSYPRADAHVALRPYLNKLVVPQGVADLARNRPPADLVLLAPKTSLVVRDDLHPALQHLLLQAAAQAHSAPGIFQKAGQFPAAEPIDLPLSETARDYHKSGSPFLQRHLPFWAAVLVAPLLVVLIPIFGVAYPLLRVLPAMYGWGMRRRIYRLYGELTFLEAGLDARRAGEPVADLLAQLDRLEERAHHMRTPAAFSHMLYTLRHHIGLVRAQLEKRQRDVVAGRGG